MCEIKKRIMEILAKIIAPSIGAKLNPEAELFQERLLDSFGLLELVSAIEAEFGLSIPGDELIIQNFNTVNAIANLIESLKKTND